MNCRLQVWGAGAFQIGGQPLQVWSAHHSEATQAVEAGSWWEEEDAVGLREPVGGGAAIPENSQVWRTTKLMDNGNQTYLSAVTCPASRTSRSRLGSLKTSPCASPRRRGTGRRKPRACPACQVLLQGQPFHLLWQPRERLCRRGRQGSRYISYSCLFKISSNLAITKHLINFPFFQPLSVPAPHRRPPKERGVSSSEEEKMERGVEGGGKRKH